MAAEGDAPGAIAQILADDEADEADRGAEEEGGGAAQQEALHGGGPERRGAAENREIFGENRRRVAASVLASIPGFSCVTMSTILLISAFALWVYHDAYMAYETFSREGVYCDQPLDKWLFIAVLILPVQLVCVIVYRKLRTMRPPRRRRRRDSPRQPRYVWMLGAFLRLWLLVVNPFFLLWGYNYTTHSRNCDPALMDAASEFITFEAIVVAGSIIIVYCVTPAVLGAHASGRVAGRQQARRGAGQPARRQMTASEGAIDRIETVPFSPELFSEASDDQEPPECCICQMEFDADNPIKRTLCKHFFHETCLADWIGNYSKACPLCRTDLDVPDGAAG